MFHRWGRWVYRNHRRVLALSALILLASLAVVLRGGPLTTGTIHGIEAHVAAEALARDLGPTEARGFTVVLESDRLSAEDPAFAQAVRDAVAPLRDAPGVLSVRTPFDPAVSVFESASMVDVELRRALVFVSLTAGAAEDTRGFAALRARLRPGSLRATVTGVTAFKSDLDRVLEDDLLRAELVSVPITALVLVLVFDSLVAALLPVGVGVLAVLGGVAAVLLLARRLEVAQYALNVVSLVGLGVAIDYSLFVVNRFREELARGLGPEEALAQSLATAGRAVAFSGLAVAIGLSGLLFFRGSYLVSLGLGGTVVVTLAVGYALTFLPALLAALGPRVNAGRVPLPRGWDAEGWWRSLARSVMRHPLLVLLPTLALLVAAGHPFLRLQTATPDVTVLPARSEARRGHELLREHFPERVQTRVVAVVRFPGPPLGDRARVGALYDLSRFTAGLPAVARVESVVDADPTLDREGYQAVLTGPSEALGEALKVARDATVGARLALVVAVTDHPPASPEARALVRSLRARRAVGDGALWVTGPTAVDLDSSRFLRERAPPAGIFVVAMTALVLFLLLGSVLLPLKAVVMNLLSITGSFGALVWIFQDGHLRGLLGFAPGPVEPSLPVIMFCATFGLSMDYEVLLLTRMQEEYDRGRDNALAVAEGLARSGRLITSAAAVMVAVFAAFAMAQVVLLKAVGLGMAVAVALDATVVRVLVVPATMRLFGDLNWWAPAPLARLYRKLSWGGEH